MRLSGILLVFAICLFSPLFVDAQVSGIPRVTDTALDVSFSPRYPGPGETVRVSIDDARVDVYRSDVAWIINGAIVERGVGITSISFPAPDFDERAVVRVVVTPPTGSQVERTLTVISAELNLLWESRAQVPPFYKGKTMFVADGEVTVEALPRFFDAGGNPINPDSLVYRWQRNGNILMNESGLGKKSVSFKGRTIGGPETVSVLIESPTRDIAFEKKVVVNPQKPMTLLYINHPLLGVDWANALGQTARIELGEVSLTAFPYFLGGNKLESLFRWSVNNQDTVSGSGDTITLRSTSGQTPAFVSVNVTTSYSRRQEARSQSVITIGR